MVVPARHDALVTWKLNVWLKGIERAPQKSEAKKSPPMRENDEIAPLASAPTAPCNVCANGSEKTRIPALAKQLRKSNEVKPGPTNISFRTQTLSRTADALLCISWALCAVGP
eukprot:CAMPEP_0172784148 /NCGR_PEP_ID=MMETSP1074-20121228/204797_1 /TAXON_ID=2916 /ORGANISM="Ceratium fusus, Strain PA161109" /LENGTH=112 /DNA_ID=CAMNT_0013621147 /DNA_START=920 /DNA_END=1258 /DNA_ORIENTATION=-